MVLSSMILYSWIGYLFKDEEKEEEEEFTRQSIFSQFQTKTRGKFVELQLQEFQFRDDSNARNVDHSKIYMIVYQAQNSLR